MSQGLSACWIVMCMGLLLAGMSGCGGKSPPPNEKVTKANADRIVVNKTTLTEVEQLLGQGTDYSDPFVDAGLKGKKWGVGKDGEEIKVLYQPDGKVVSVSYTKWDETK